MDSLFEVIHPTWWRDQLSLALHSTLPSIVYVIFEILIAFPLRKYDDLLDK